MSPTIRNATSADTHFIHSSWFNSYWGKYARKHIERDVYAHGQDALIQKLLFRSEVLVAYFEEVPDEVLGWACLEGDVCHWVYVKGVYRRRGIASGLVEGRAKWYTQRTDTIGGRFAAKVQMQFNPYRLEK